MLSIIYITCNRSKELEKSILSCENSITIEHEYVIVDNGSKDDTKDVVEKLIERGIPIRYLLQEKNYGVSGGRNIGFREAKGCICYFIDDDATIITEGNCLDEAFGYMKDNPKVYAMGTDCYDVERKSRLVGIHEKSNGSKNSNDLLNIRNYLGGSHFIRKSAIESEWLYPDNLMYGAEELYAGMTIYRNGGVIKQYNALKILHEPSKSTRESRENRQRNGHINTYVIKKYFLPKWIMPISHFLFSLRLLRFERFKIFAVKNDLYLVKQRYDNKYRKPISTKLLLHLCCMFGVKNLV